MEKDRFCGRTSGLLTGPIRRSRTGRQTFRGVTSMLIKAMLIVGARRAVPLALHLQPVGPPSTEEGAVRVGLILLFAPCLGLASATQVDDLGAHGFWPLRVFRIGAAGNMSSTVVVIASKKGTREPFRLSA